MKAVIVGSGPVGCMAALRFRERGWETVLLDASADPRVRSRQRRRSINLTLCRRGLRTLPRAIANVLYEEGVACVHRVVHQRDGSLVSLPYGLTPDEHLVSISRERLNHILLNEVQRAGVELRFNHECVRANPDQASASFLAGGELVEFAGDILVGCDGSNSMVRHEMARRGARMYMHQEYIAHGYVELVVPATEAGAYCWPPTRGVVYRAEGAIEHGLHVWPRGNSMIFAQPNTDKTYTISLFAPATAADDAEDSFEDLTSAEAVRAFFGRHFPDVIPHMPRLAEDMLSTSPAALRTMKCAPYHHGRTVLLGDAAHTMVPFFGQGVNSGFEDVQVFFGLLDEASGGLDLVSRIRRSVGEFTRVRRPSAHAITDLSLGNFNELVEQSGNKAFQARHALERQLHRRSPERFQPLLNMVSFSELNYDEIVRVHHRQRGKLDRLCQMFDAETQTERIIQAYLDESPASQASAQDEQRPLSS